MNKLPRTIIVKRELRYSTEKELADLAEIYEDMTDEEKYFSVIESFFEYACEDLARSWNKITMLDEDTGAEIPWWDILDRKKVDSQ